VQRLDLKRSKLQNESISVQVLSSWLLLLKGLKIQELMNKETWFHLNAMNSGLLKSIHLKDGRNYSLIERRASVWLSRYLISISLVPWYRATIETVKSHHSSIQTIKKTWPLEGCPGISRHLFWYRFFMILNFCKYESRQHW